MTPRKPDNSGPGGLETIAALTPAGIAATWFGTGLLPRAPGTWGSLAALPFAWVIASAGGTTGLLAAVAAVSAIGLWATALSLKRPIGDDPGAIVIDEVAGQWLTLAVVPPGLLAYAVGFLYFRLFDVLKPWPVSWADRRLKGAFGVMADDLVAAVYAGAATWGTMAALTAMGIP